MQTKEFVRKMACEIVVVLKTMHYTKQSGRCDDGNGSTEMFAIVVD